MHKFAENDSVDALMELDEPALDKFLSTKNSDGLYFVHEAAAGDAAKCIEYLAKKRPEQLDKVDGSERQWTPLHYAADKGHQTMVSLLIEHGVSLYAKSSPETKGNQAIHLATFRGFVQVVKLLIDRLPDLRHSKNGAGSLPIHFAVLENEIELVKYFVELGVDVNTPDLANHKRTCLHHAASRGHLKLVKWLVKKGAHICAKSSHDDNESMPIHLAAFYGYLPVVQYFIENYPNLLNTPNGKGETPLQLAKSTNNNDVVTWIESKA